MESTEPQEDRTKRLSVMATPSEWKAVKIVAAKHGAPISDLLRDRLLVDIMAEYSAMVRGSKPAA